jgi:hypothetical protein
MRYFATEKPDSFLQTNISWSFCRQGTIKWVIFGMTYPTIYHNICMIVWNQSFNQLKSWIALSWTFKSEISLHEGEEFPRNVDVRDIIIPNTLTTAACNLSHGYQFYKENYFAVCTFACQKQ